MAMAAMVGPSSHVTNQYARARCKRIRLAECLLADQGPVRHFLLAGLEPRQHLRFEEAELGIGVGGRLVLLQFVRVAGQRVLSVLVRLGYRSRDRKSRLSRINDARRLRSAIASVVKPP
jgi:hypothetical protein